jgi:CheY-like chemotaxis protein
VACSGSERITLVRSLGNRHKTGIADPSDFPVSYTHLISAHRQIPARAAPAVVSHFAETFFVNPVVGEPDALKVLIVDDNQDAADALASVLQMWGYNVRIAYGGQVGLQAAIESPPDCVLLDINMPLMDGFAVAQRIRQRPVMQNIKLIALTAYSDEAQIKKMWEAGFDYYLNKLCDLSDIKRVLEMYGKGRPRSEGEAHL